MRPLHLVLTTLFACLLTLSAIAGGSPSDEQSDQADLRVLVFSHTTGFRHKSIPEGIVAVETLGRKHGFLVDKTEDPANFTSEKLSKYAAVVFMNTNGTLFDDEQRLAFTEYIRGGGGYVGVHSASATEYEWDWYRRLVGAFFKTHPKVQPAVIVVEDQEHVSTRHLPERWEHTDEWYNFRKNPRAKTRVLLSLDTSSMEGSTMEEDHPLAWYHAFDGGRAWFTALGHTKECYSEPLFLKHLLGGIQWAANSVPPEM